MQAMIHYDWDTLVVAFEPAARSKRPPNDQTNHAAGTRKEPTTLLWTRERKLKAQITFGKP